MMNRDHGPNGLQPTGGGGPPPAPGPPPPPAPRYMPPRVPSVATHHERPPPAGVPTAAAMSRAAGPIGAAAMAGPVPGPLERAIAAAHHPSAHAVAAVSAQAQGSLSHDAAASAFAPNAPAVAKKNSSAGSPPPSPTKSRYKKRTKKYNNFNIFFMLERQLLLQSRGGGIDAVEKPIDTSDSPLTKHKDLRLPPLCRRYRHLPLTSNWFLELLANQNKKRPHRKSHGLIPFKELAQTVAKNYREIDDETQSFVNEVAERLGWHCEEIEAIEARERREQEDRERSSGNQPSRKRKDAPVVSVAGANKLAAVKALSGDEAATVRNLMGMKVTEPKEAAPLAVRSVLPPDGVGPLQAHPVAPLPSRHPVAGRLPVMSQAPDAESDRLRFELAQAMNARRDSEQRIQLLREQMTMRSVQQDQHRAAAARASHSSPSALHSLPPYDPYLASLIAAAGGSPPLSSRSRPPVGGGESTMGAPKHPSSLHEVEKALLKEALARKLIPSGAPLDALYPGAHAAQRGRPALAAVTLPVPSSAAGRGQGVPLKKRQRFTFERSEDVDVAEKAEAAAKLNEEKQEKEAERSSSRGSQDGLSPAANGASARPQEIELYKDLYAKMLANRHAYAHRAPDPSPVAASTAARDLALLDSLAAARPHLGRARSSPVEQALLESLAARRGAGHPSSFAPHYPPPSAHPTPGYPPSAPSYEALLAHLAARERLRHPAAGPSATPPVAAAGYPHAARSASASPPKRKPDLLEMVHAASRDSRFGLSYNDILDVWKEVHRDQNGGSERASEQGKVQHEDNKEG